MLIVLAVLTVIAIVWFTMVANDLLTQLRRIRELLEKIEKRSMR